MIIKVSIARLSKQLPIVVHPPTRLLKERCRKTLVECRTIQKVYLIYANLINTISASKSTIQTIDDALLILYTYFRHVVKLQKYKKEGCFSNFSFGVEYLFTRSQIYYVISTNEYPFCAHTTSITYSKSLKLIISIRYIYVRLEYIKNTPTPQPSLPGFLIFSIFFCTIYFSSSVLYKV